MATITPPPARARHLSDYQRRVRSPLARLRGYIRLYVGLEGALLFVLCLALWFWFGLALDYGFFRLFGIDWVQEWPWAVRLVLLVLVSAGVLTLVSLNVVGRLVRDFRDVALALVLERRFPRLLGDRLITAVELSDLRLAEEQGYSPAMVMETIHEAAERVEQAPVQKAFDWRRLVRRGVLAAALTAGLYVVVGGLFLLGDALWHTKAGRTGYARFNETALIWVERNILLQNTIWPRRAQLELIGFPAKELRIGKDYKIPPLRLRALEWVVADTNAEKAPEGWRALTWWDLANKHDLLPGVSVPEPPFAITPRDPDGVPTVAEVALRLRRFDVRTAPTGQAAKWQVADAGVRGGWRPLLWADLTPERLDGLSVPAPLPDWAAKDPAVGLTADDVEAAVAAVNRARAPEAVGAADAILNHLGRIAAVHALFDQLDARAAQPDMSRRLRRLDVPDVIYLKCTGDRTYLRNELRRGQDNEYTGNFGELKESVSFTVQADDYWTPRRAITLVPPPALVGLGVREDRPAYLYYRPSEATTLAFLRGKKQPFEEHDVLQAGSETSRIDLPAGTDVVLTAKSDKKLSEAVLKGQKNLDEIRVRIDPAKAPAGAGVRIDPAAGEPGVFVVRPEKAGDAIRLPLELIQGGKGFRLDLPDVRKDLVFDFEFTDTDGVKAKRKVVVKPQDDTAPEMTDVAVEFIRKATFKTTGHDETYYLVTRKARIPLSAKVHDDHCLGDVRYRYTLVTSGKSDANAVFMVPVAALAAPVGGLGMFQAAAYLLAQDRDADSYAPPAFAQAVNQAQDDLPLQAVTDQLAQAQKPPFRQLVHDLEIKPDVAEQVQKDPLTCDFPLWTLPQMQDLDDSHPAYRMDLWMEASDTDADEQLGPDGLPRPHLSKSKETFQFLIVPESQLLAKIGEDEVKLYASLNKRFQDLNEKSGMLDTSIAGLNRPDVAAKELLAPSTRAEQINEVLENTLATTRETYSNYQRIIREEQLNVVKPERITHAQEKIVDPLRLILESDFPAVLSANEKFRKALDDKGMSDKERIDASRAAGKDVTAKMAKLLADLNAVLDVMKGLEGLDTLILRASTIRDGVQRQAEMANAIRFKLEDDFFK